MVLFFFKISHIYLSDHEMLYLFIETHLLYKLLLRFTNFTFQGRAYPVRWPKPCVEPPYPTVILAISTRLANSFWSALKRISRLQKEALT